VLARDVQPLEVGVHRPHLGGAPALHAREAQVRADGDVPGAVHDPGGRAEEVAGEVLGAVGQARPEPERLEGGHGHPLAVHRVEVGERVTDDEVAAREAAQPLVPAPAAHRDPEAHRLRQRLGVADHLVDDR
jgi:hypothetical protein